MSNRCFDESNAASGWYKVCILGAAQKHYFGEKHQCREIILNPIFLLPFMCREIQNAIDKLSKRHEKHIAVYDPQQGKDNALRLIGIFCTSPIGEFSSGMQLTKKKYLRGQYLKF